MITRLIRRRPHFLRGLRVWLRLEWLELGRLGRVGLFGIVVAGALAVSLGFRIESVARVDLLNARADVLSRVVDTLPSDISNLQPGSPDFDRFDTAVSRQLLGGETVRVKVWLPDGTIVYSDAADLIGRNFDVADDRLEALEGRFSHKTADLDGPENIYDRNLGDLIEFYLPVRDSSDAVVGAFEVYERNDSIGESLTKIRGDVWWSVGLGLFVMGLFITVLGLAIARSLDSRRRAAENLAISLTRKREEDRLRIVGALHDDVSQPLYRVLYGLQGCSLRVNDQSIINELKHLETLTREIEVTIRAELRNFHGPVLVESGFRTAIDQLILTTKDETDLEVRLDVDGVIDLSPEAETVVYRAIQESIFNVRRHADASWVEVSIGNDLDQMTVSVADDGVGWDGTEGIGLTTTRQMLREVDGEFDIDLRNPHGTRTCIRVPIPEVSS